MTAIWRFEQTPPPEASNDIWTFPKLVYFGYLFKFACFIVTYSSYFFLVDVTELFLTMQENS